ncbi:prostatic acid phosphatase-like [Daphnia pulicaria]|uniref:prostatic acid phosphatase-like n=1 Tax=Daphnia pulicaria TaxID=35523 RepID=UPI001EEAAA67|nr:prostatic acid phosphatase-like [Daphnia pulicaria]
MDWFTLALSFALFLCVSGETEYLGKATNTLRLVHMLYRHGDRTPVRPYPLDPYLNLTHWPVSWGQLTKEGKERHFKLGQLNRERYGDFLSETYNPDEIYVRSTDVDRTLMSAECHLAGLFQPNDNQTWHPDLAWQPIPVHTIAKEQDLLLVLESECPRYDELLAQLNSSPDVRKRMDSNKEMLDYLAVNSGLNMTEIDDIEYLYDTLFIEDRFNKTLPEWTTKYFPSPMKEFSDFSFEMKAYNLEMQRLRGGPLVKELVEHLGAYAQSKLTPPNRKLFMYSAHDVTVATFLSALNIFNGIQPPYASMVLVELHELKPNDFSVKILYKNVSDDGRNPEVLSLPGCTRFCPLDKFFQLVQNATSDDIKVECKLVKPDASTFDTMLVISLLASLSCLLLVALLVIGALWYRKVRQENGYAYSTIQAE